MSITTIIGPMFSGKTTEFIRLIDRQRLSGKKCLIIKHSIDDRFTNNNNIITHNDFNYDKCDIIYTNELNYYEGYDVIGIDEGFFFKNISNYCNEMANNGIYIIVASIDSSYKQELFPEIGKLIATSDIVIKLDSICMQCGTSAAFSIRIINNNEDIIVGGKEAYQSVCRKCLKKHKETLYN